MTAKGYCELDRAQLTKEQKLGLLLCANLSQGEKDVEDALTKTGRGRSFDLMLPSIAENARAVTEYGASIGIRTCTENHGRIAQDNDRLERLFNAVAHDNYGLLIDMGNFLFVDEDPVMAVSRLAPYAFHVHAKDFTKKAEKDASHPIMSRAGTYLAGGVIGEGVVPVKRCLSILKAAGYDGYVSIEFEGCEDCVAAIGRGHANLKSYIESL